MSVRPAMQAPTGQSTLRGACARQGSTFVRRGSGSAAGGPSGDRQVAPARRAVVGDVLAAAVGQEHERHEDAVGSDRGGERVERVVDELDVGVEHDGHRGVAGGDAGVGGGAVAGVVALDDARAVRARDGDRVVGRGGVDDDHASAGGERAEQPLEVARRVVGHRHVGEVPNDLTPAVATQGADRLAPPLARRCGVERRRPRACCRAHLRPVHALAQSLRGSCGSAGRVEPAAGLGDDLGRAAARRRHHRHARGQRLDHRDAERLAVGAVQQHRRALERGPRILDSPAQLDPAVEVGSRGTLAQPLAQPLALAADRLARDDDPQARRPARPPPARARAASTARSRRARAHTAARPVRPASTRRDRRRGG